MLRSQILGLIYKAIMDRDKTHGTRFTLYWTDHFCCVPTSRLGSVPQTYVASLRIAIDWQGFASKQWTYLESKAADMLKSKGLL